uniref:Uncharacterized protein n=1 Tax=Manihot esculenta TaxID=3983 RepID=A0A2C9UF09_MANES
MHKHAAGRPSAAPNGYYIYIVRSSDTETRQSSCMFARKSGELLDKQIL